jgi:hypothetical protein
MNSTLFQPAECSRDLDIFTDDMAAIDDAFATMPMPSIPPAFLTDQEEEVYTSFEEGISDRVLAMQRQFKLRRLSDQLSGSLADMRASEPMQAASILIPILPPQHFKRITLARLTQKGRHILLLGGLSLAMALLGFDLMGLLVLQLR